MIMIMIIIIIMIRISIAIIILIMTNIHIHNTHDSNTNKKRNNNNNNNNVAAPCTSRAPPGGRHSVPRRSLIWHSEGLSFQFDYFIEECLCPRTPV